MKKEKGYDPQSELADIMGAQKQPVVPAEKKYSPEDIEKMNQIRRAADITFSRVKKYSDLEGESLDEGNEKFIEQTKKLWKEFAVHGMMGRNEETGLPELKSYSDLDGEMSLTLLRLAGIETRKLEYVNKGEYIENYINVDTGNQSGVISNYGKKRFSKTAWLDHHGEDSKNDTSAAKITYEALVGLGLLKAEPYLDKMVEFVTQMDNKTFPNAEKYFLDSSRNVLGLWRFIKPEKLIEFFKEGGDPTKYLSEDEIEDLGLKEGSQKQKKMVEDSLKRLAEMRQEGFIIPSEKYGQIAIDINKKLKCGFDAAKFAGCGAYIIWSPDKKSFFISTVKDLEDDFGEGEGKGEKMRQTMWIKPDVDESDLEITLGEILSKMTDGKVKPHRKLKEYLEKESIDSYKASGKINKNQKNMNPEARTNQEAETNRPPENPLEGIGSPFEALESREVQSMTDAYAEKTKIDEGVSRKIDGLLSRETQETYRDFALKYFEANKGRMTEEGMPIPEGATDDWKVNMVLSSKEAMAELSKDPEQMDEQYKEFRRRIDQISILRTDMSRENIPPETPFLLLNHLQKRIDAKQTEMRAAAGKGDEYTAESIRKEVEEMYSSMREVASKTMGVDMRDKAEEQFSKDNPDLTRESYVAENTGEAEFDVRTATYAKLLEKEWKSFSAMAPKEQKAFKKQMGYREGVSLDEFKINGESFGREAAEAIASGDEEEIRKAYEKVSFMRSITNQAENFGTGTAEENRDAFYGLLSKGYKPYAAKESGIFRKRVLVPGMGEKITFDKLDELADTAGERFSGDIHSQAERRVGEDYDRTHEKIIDGIMRADLRDLSRSPERTGIEIEEIYDKAKERIVSEYITKQTKENPKMKKEAEAVEKMFGETGKKIDISKLMGDIFYERGDLADLDDDPVKKLTSFLQGLGISETDATRAVYNVPEASYIDARNSKNLYGFIRGLLNEAFHPTSPVEVVKTAAKRVRAKTEVPKPKRKAATKKS